MPWGGREAAAALLGHLMPWYPSIGLRFAVMGVGGAGRDRPQSRSAASGRPTRQAAAGGLP